MAKLLLVRHGRTKLYSPGRFWGSTDVALSEVGIGQAEKLRHRLQKEKFTAVYAAPLSRTTRTAEIIADKRDLKIIPAPEMTECNFGYTEGLTYTEISRKYPELNDVIYGLDMETRFPGGENLNEFDARVQAFLPRIRQHGQKDVVLVVAHGGSLPLLLCHLLDIPVQHWRQFLINQASLSIMETYPQGAVLTLLNDTSHLG